MYESFFDLSSRPFPAAPVVEQYFPTAVVEQARQTLIRIVDRAEGPGLVIGQPGLGKTLLLRMLDHHFQNIFHCIHLASAAIESRKDLLQNVLFELNLPYRDMEEGELRLSLLDFLRPSESCPHGVLLLVDEAHTLPLQLLDEIRMITNLVRDGQPRVRLVLAGDNQLDDVFADPRLDSFNQRIAARCYLEPLNQEQTGEYIAAQVTTSGGDPARIFTPDALVAVYRASGGIPRLVNQVCDHALVMASLGGYHQLDAAGIEEAWSDLQQLPGPWTDSPAATSSNGDSIVEFGSLDQDEPQAAPAEDHRPEPAVDASALLGDAAPAEATGRPANDGECEQIETSSTSGLCEVANPSDNAADPADTSDGHADVPLQANESVTAEADAGQPEPTPNEYYTESVVQVGWVPDAAATVDPAANPPATSGVDEHTIQATLADVTAEPQGEQPAEPGCGADAAIEPEFADPFGHDFDEEELVVDRYAVRAASVFAGFPKVESEEGRALAALIDQQPSPQLSVVDANSMQEDEQPGGDEDAEVQATAADSIEQHRASDTPATMKDTSPATGAVRGLAEEAEAAGLATNVFDTGSLSDWLFDSEAPGVVISGDGPDDGAATVGDQPAAAGHVAKNGVTEQSTAPLANPAALDGDADAVAEPDAVEEGLPEAAPAAGAYAAAEPQTPFLQMHEGPACTDDRDMIVVDEDRNEGVFLTQSGDDLARRVEYQQLFSQLREG